jgi:hypothetical protein
MRGKRAPSSAGDTPWPRHLVLAAVLCLLPVRPCPAQDALGVARAAPARDDGDDEEQLIPGLVATYRSPAAGGGGAALTRVDLKPAFTLGRSSPHPRLPEGPFEAVWEGTIQQTSADPVRFGAFLGGTLTVAVDGVTVLDARGESQSTWVEAKGWGALARGRRPIRVVYRSLTDVPARLQLWWEGQEFSWEPLPAWRLQHRASERTTALARDDAVARGRSEAQRFGCAQCHRSAFPSAAAPPPGPSLAGAGRRLGRAWLLHWFDDPAGVRDGARMPALFAADRAGFVERSLVADFLLEAASGRAGEPAPGKGNALEGKTSFLGLGCATCHRIPHLESDQRLDPEVYPLVGLRERMPLEHLARFLEDPGARYPDGRMPRLPMKPQVARDIAAYLLQADGSLAKRPGAAPAGVTSQEVAEVARRLGVTGPREAGRALAREKGCVLCHAGLGDKAEARDIPTTLTPGGPHDRRGCLSGPPRPRFSPGEAARAALGDYLAVASRERHESPFEARQQRLARHGCFRCHRRDSDLPSPLEEVSGTVFEHNLQRLPSQKTPRLSYVLSKYLRAYVVNSVRDGVSGVRPPWYSYRMPAFGGEAGEIVRALAEGDGDPTEGTDPLPRKAVDPELPAAGPSLVGSAGYSCVACHVWNGTNLTEPEPGAAGPELMSVASRIRRDYFDRWLDDPSRVVPRTPMPQIFQRGKPAMPATILGGDPKRQKDALWSYLMLGRDAPSPVSLPPTPVPSPRPGEPPLVAQIPLHLADGTVVEAIGVLYATHDLLLYDVGGGSLAAYQGAQILRIPKDRRSFQLQGTPLTGAARPSPRYELVSDSGSRRERPSKAEFLGYERLADGARLGTRLHFPGGSADVAEAFRVEGQGAQRRLVREVEFRGSPAGSRVEANEPCRAVLAHLPPPVDPPLPATLPAVAGGGTVAPGVIDGETQRPGYRAIAYPRPRTVYGEDRVMPGALATDPRTGRLYIASMKLGELLTLDDPNDDGTNARFHDYARGLFQDAYGMSHDGSSLYLLHRRNLTRIRDLDGDGTADSFERVAALEHEVTENVDNAYGLVRRPDGTFVFTYAVNTPRRRPGWGSALRLTPGPDGVTRELAFGLRRAYGWCLGPDDEIFFTDNQGEWVPTNKLCHADGGRYFGYPNPGQEQQATRSTGKAAVWVPYGWATSTNGLVRDTTGGKFGPFAGQFFMAGWTDRGGVIRAQVEKVNGEFQGACFPFWGKGMLGPLVLAFDPRGRLFVGGITEGTCGAQPDRGGLFRIDFTGLTPFEVREIHVRPHGFRLTFTRPVERGSAGDPASYSAEHYRYAYSGDYGSPELDRTRSAVTRVEVHDDAQTVDLTTAPLVKERVYMISARGVRSREGEPLRNHTGAYTLNEIPGE